MSHSKPNPTIHCRVSSCCYHYDEGEYCSLQSIQVEPCHACGNGNPSDESMCASYRKK